MNTILLRTEKLHLRGEVTLTGSKSESNRALILKALGKGAIQVENLSEAEDTETLDRVLQDIKSYSASSANDLSQPLVVDIGPAGTAMRFLTAYLSITKGSYQLTGSLRMQQRPIGILVDALRGLGAEIKYLKQEGFPPLGIDGLADMHSGDDQNVSGNHVKMDGSVSSQYLSALLLISSQLPEGLRLEIDGELTSRPYLTMTLQILEECGIQYDWQDSVIYIGHQNFQATTLYVEPDWSAASYWYSLLALSASGNLFLKGLKRNSLQGDRQIAELMVPFGVKSRFEENGVWLEKCAVTAQDGDLIDLQECPDLAQTLVVCAAALKKNVRFKGLHTLRIKETDRIFALQTELSKFGVKFLENETGETFTLDCPEIAGKKTASEIAPIATYEDHRMAMAFAPLVACFGELRIEEPAVVGKSYPEFWKHLQSKGIEITETN